VLVHRVVLSASSLGKNNKFGPWIYIFLSLLFYYLMGKIERQKGIEREEEKIRGRPEKEKEGGREREREYIRK
jgi:hypothetical protein